MGTCTVVHRPPASTARSRRRSSADPTRAWPRPPISSWLHSSLSQLLPASFLEAASSRAARLAKSSRITSEDGRSDESGQAQEAFVCEANVAQNGIRTPSPKLERCFLVVTLDPLHSAYVHCK